MMQCDDAEGFIELLATGDGGVPPDAAAHAAGCPRCRVALRVARAVEVGLAARVTPALSRDFAATVLQRSRLEPVPAPQPLCADLAQGLALPALLLALGTYLVVDSRRIAAWFATVWDGAASQAAVVVTAPIAHQPDPLTLFAATAVVFAGLTAGWMLFSGRTTVAVRGLCRDL